MNAEQRMKDTARSYAGVYKRYGKLVPQPCAVCGSPDVEMHHPDYAKPIEVNWFCRPCHLAFHREKTRSELVAWLQKAVAEMESRR
jgi:hypothetical protein